MPVPEAKLVERDGGLEPDGPGWFIVNVADTLSFKNEVEGQYIRFESLDNAPFPHYGIGIHVLRPGQPNAKYHAESNQEGFLVVAGECELLVEGEQRRLVRWDFFHCPPWTEHAFVGAAEGPCVIVMVGARSGPEVRYPVSELAARHGASVAEATCDWRQAYATVERFRRERPPNWARLPWA